MLMQVLKMASYNSQTWLTTGEHVIKESLKFLCTNIQWCKPGYFYGWSVSINVLLNYTTSESQITN